MTDFSLSSPSTEAGELGLPRGALSRRKPSRDGRGRLAAAAAPAAAVLFVVCVCMRRDTVFFRFIFPLNAHGLLRVAGSPASFTSLLL